MDNGTAHPTLPKSGIIRRRSLLFPLVGLLILTVLSTMAVGYFINYPFLYQSLHNKAQIENEARAAHIGFLLKHESNTLIQLALVISRDGELQEAFTYYKRDANRLMRKVLFLSETIHDVDFFGVIDAQGKTLFSTIDSGEDVAFPAEAIQRTLKGNSYTLSNSINNRWSFMSLAPILIQRQIVGVLVLGRWINQDLAKRMTVKDTLGLAFAGPDKTLTSSFDQKIWPTITPDSLQTCFANTLVTLDENSQKGLYYSPLQIMGNTFCLILPLDYEPIHQTLRDHTQRLAWSSLIIIFMILLLGLTLQFLILKPLHRLRNKALILIEVCTNEKPQISEVAKGVEGNEIKILDHAFETASTAIYSYICELNHQKERFEDMAIRDPLTGLGNRRLFTQLLEKAISLCARHQRKMAILYLDLDHFKPINDTLGHDIGDLLLKEVSVRLKLALRESDVVFRLGGDEFAALLPECAGGEMARMMGNRIIQEVTRPYLLQGHDCLIGVSVGVAIYPDHADSVERLLKNADLALYAAKDAGRGVCRLYEDLTKPSSA
ncbi:MAG: diguanylate cyclase [Magnetococcales bacterium]|nr:diguanylate cyclase [Magnetococcales bacterium]MBF0438078.1 diguanylate cyclase [Magnetococcales bacterium]